MKRSATLGNLAVVQSVVGALALAAIACVPPAHGTMLIVPVLSTARPAAIATRSDALIVAKGDLPGSIVVVGDRSQIVQAAFADGDVVVATNVRGCTEQFGTPI